MANLFEHTDRRVVPNWRSFERTIALGELNSSQIEPNIVRRDINIDEYIFDWKINKTVIHAADLLSAAIVNNRLEDLSVKDAANFILDNIELSSKSQISLAEKIVKNNIEEDWSAQFDKIKLDELPAFMNQELVREKIREIKTQLASYSINPIYYVELARYYSILGQEANAVRAMKTALHIAPNNRFLLRSATRLFTHYHHNNEEYLEYIHNILRKSRITSYDPWLISAELAIATIRDRTSMFIKKGLGLIESNNISPFNFTELASSLGTIELLNGGTKKSRALFNKALINPNDNSLAQIEWASTKDKQLDINPSNFGVKMNFEAVALNGFHGGNFNLALENAVKWFVDMPFSMRPIMFGSNLASTILNDQKKSISFLNAGLLAHPNDPILLNNIAYALALDNKPDDAIKELGKIKEDNINDESTEICLTATRGLTYFRKGLHDAGRQLYLSAIEQTKAINNQELNWIAILNYAREELLVKSDFVEHVMDAVFKIPDTDNMGVKVLKKRVIDLHKKNKET